MVFASICGACEQYVYFCEHEQWSNIFFASSEQLKKYRWRAASTSLIFWTESRSLLKKKYFATSNLADTVQPIPAVYGLLCLVGWWCQITSGIFEWASVRYTRSRRSKAFSLIRHYEHITGRSLKVPGIQVLWQGRSLVVSIFVGNVNNETFRLTSISSFGFDDWQA